MSKQFKPIETAQLSWKGDAPFSSQFGDIYFSPNQGLAESDYVFIQGNDLLKRWRTLQPSEHFVIGELGFGSGLNFLATWAAWQKHAPPKATLHYYSVEKFPLTKKDLQLVLKPFTQLTPYAEALLDTYPELTPGFHHISLEGGRVQLTLMLGDALACYEQLLMCRDTALQKQLSRRCIDAWYLDGFAPGKNTQMWEESLFKVLGLLSGENTTLATFSASSLVRKNLENAGFKVTKIKGFQQKREMITATKTLKEVSLDKPNTPWAFGKPHIHKEKQVTIVGAGLAGSFIAYELANKGWKVHLIDKDHRVCQGASANSRALLFPNLSAYDAPLTSFMLSGFLYSTRTLRGILYKTAYAEWQGLLQLIDLNLSEKQIAQLKTWLECYPKLGRMVTQEEAHEIAGIGIDGEAIHIPLAGCINTVGLCERLTQHENIELILGFEADELTFENNLWHMGGVTAPSLVIANGFQSNHFKQTRYLPIKPIRGQMSWIEATVDSRKLKLPVCGKGHVLPEKEGLHALGATYGLNQNTAKVVSNDDLENLAKLSGLASQINWSGEVKQHWAGVRASTPDYLPMVGPVAEQKAFQALYGRLALNAKYFIEHPAPCYPGLYVMTGFGSRGLTTIPLAAKWLAGHINQELSILPRQLVESISPVRFLRKAIVKNQK